jgi:hypothetical protein
LGGKSPAGAERLDTFSGTTGGGLQAVLVAAIEHGEDWALLRKKEEDKESVAQHDMLHTFSFRIRSALSCLTSTTKLTLCSMLANSHNNIFVLSEMLSDLLYILDLMTRFCGVLECEILIYKILACCL